MPESVIWETLVDFKGHWAYLTTQNYVKLCHWMVNRQDLSQLAHLKSLFVAGTVVPPEYEAFYLKNVSSLKYILNGYGQTELCVISISPNPTTLGYVLPGCTVRVSCGKL